MCCYHALALLHFTFRNFSNGKSIRGIVDSNGVQIVVLSFETRQQSNT